MADVRLFGYTTDHHTGWTHGVSGHSPRTINVFCGTKEGASSMYGKGDFCTKRNNSIRRKLIQRILSRVFGFFRSRRLKSCISKLQFCHLRAHFRPRGHLVQHHVSVWRDIRGVFTDPNSGRPLNWAGLDPHIP